MTSFPIHAKVILHGLKTAELNGQRGVVQSDVAASNGRQTVYIEELNKSVALKPINLEYEERSLEELSVKELKVILSAKNVSIDSIQDKSELRELVTNLTMSNQEISHLLAHEQSKQSKQKEQISQASSSSSSGFVPTKDMASQAADQLSNMSPEQLRQQAQMMRSMDANSIRRMNPQLAHMTDDQIRMAADQMEMMANNPAMVKMATAQMKQMSPDDMQRMMQDHVSKQTAQTSSPNLATSNNTSSTTSASIPTSRNTTTSTTTHTPTSIPSAAQASKMMADMTPEQMKQQAAMMKSMDPNQLRQMNPQLATMTDAQIQMAANQFEMMASNPEMMKMAMEQMKQMSPDDLSKLGSTSTSGTSTGSLPSPADLMGGADATKLLESMDPKQLKQMLTTLKQDPNMLKQFASMSGMSEEQLVKGVDMFAGMEDDKMKATLNLMAKASKMKDLWNRVNSKLGGHLLAIIIVASVLFVLLIIQWLWFRNTSGTNILRDAQDDVGDNEEISILDQIPNLAHRGVNNEF